LPGTPEIPRASPPAGPTGLHAAGCEISRFALPIRKRKTVARAMHLPHNDIREFGKLTLKPASPLLIIRKLSFAMQELTQKKTEMVPK
jgi:hypothetical protein